MNQQIRLLDLLALYMRSRYYPLFIVFFILFACTDLPAQLRYVQAKAAVGSIIKHRTTIDFDTDTPTYGVDLSVYWPTQGTKPWQEKQHFPRFFLSGGYLDLGDPDILGEAWTLFGGLELNLFRKPKSALHFGYAIGYAYLNRPFDRVSNPTNTAIGSHLNNCLGYQYGYNTSIAVFGLHTGDFTDDDQARVGASRHAIVAGNEFLFGPWALQIKAGIYLNRSTGFLIPRPYYFQLSPRYYFNSQSRSRTKIYANLQLKSHLFIAEYIAFGVGMVYR